MFTKEKNQVKPLGDCLTFRLATLHSCEIPELVFDDMFEAPYSKQIIYLLFLDFKSLLRFK